MSINLIPLIVGVIGLLAAFIVFRAVMTYPVMAGKPEKIARQIQLGAMAFMSRELKLIAASVAVIAVAIVISPLGYQTAIAFLTGAICSALAGFLGMYAATRANVRTTSAAHEFGSGKALTVAFYGGSVMGLVLASLGLLGLGTLYFVFGTDPETAHRIHGFGMGAGVVALFYRVGGGIFTKAADVGADLVGKVEAGIPEDDPRNPGVIADNVGDNVGDVAGMGSDLYESYVSAVAATMFLGKEVDFSASFPGLGFENLGLNVAFLFGVLGIVASIIGYFFVSATDDEDVSYEQQAANARS